MLTCPNGQFRLVKWDDLAREVAEWFEALRQVSTNKGLQS
jgi:hypothetical protein